MYGDVDDGDEAIYGDVGDDEVGKFGFDQDEAGVGGSSSSSIHGGPPSAPATSTERQHYENVASPTAAGSTQPVSKGSKEHSYVNAVVVEQHARSALRGAESQGTDPAITRPALPLASMDEDELGPGLGNGAADTGDSRVPRSQSRDTAQGMQGSPSARQSEDEYSQYVSSEVAAVACCCVGARARRQTSSMVS